jgi:hypothetical protein
MLISKTSIRGIFAVATVLFVLFASATWSRSGSFVWTNPTYEVSEPYADSGDDWIYGWGAGFSFNQSDSINGASLTWNGELYAHAGIETTMDFNQVAITSGHSTAAAAYLYSDIWASWEPNQGSPPDDPPSYAQIDVAMSFGGYVYGKTVGWQEYNTTPTDDGDMIWSIAGAGASANAYADTTNPGSPSAGASVGGGMTNSLPGGGIGGDYDLQGVEIVSRDSEAGHDAWPMFHGESWWWWDSISFSINISEGYVVPCDYGSIAVSPSLDVSAHANLHLFTEETNWERVYGLAEAAAYISGSIIYTASPQL